MFRGRLAGPDATAGNESLDARLLGVHEIPWDDLAFPVIEKTLIRYVKDRSRSEFTFHIDDIERRDIQSVTLPFTRPQSR